jgi:hypothetical protein
VTPPVVQKGSKYALFYFLSLHSTVLKLLIYKSFEDEVHKRTSIQYYTIITMSTAIGGASASGSAAGSSTVPGSIVRSYLRCYEDAGAPKENGLNKDQRDSLSSVLLTGGANLQLLAVASDIDLQYDTAGAHGRRIRRKFDQPEQNVISCVAHAILCHISAPRKDPGDGDKIHALAVELVDALQKHTPEDPLKEVFLGEIDRRIRELLFENGEPVEEVESPNPPSGAEDNPINVETSEEASDDEPEDENSSTLHSEGAMAVKKKKAKPKHRAKPVWEADSKEFSSDGGDVRDF